MEGYMETTDIGTEVSFESLEEVINAIRQASLNVLEDEIDTRQNISFESLIEVMNNSKQVSNASSGQLVDTVEQFSFESLKDMISSSKSVLTEASQELHKLDQLSTKSSEQDVSASEPISQRSSSSPSQLASRVPSDKVRSASRSASGHQSGQESLGASRIASAEQSRPTSPRAAEDGTGKTRQAKNEDISLGKQPSAKSPHDQSKDISFRPSDENVKSKSQILGDTSRERSREPSDENIKSKSQISGDTSRERSREPSGENIKSEIQISGVTSRERSRSPSDENIKSKTQISGDTSRGRSGGPLDENIKSKSQILGDTSRERSREPSDENIKSKSQISGDTSRERSREPSGKNIKSEIQISGVTSRERSRSPSDENIKSKTQISGDTSSGRSGGPLDENIKSKTQISGDTSRERSREPSGENIKSKKQISGDTGKDRFRTPSDENIKSTTHISADPSRERSHRPSDENINLMKEISADPSREMFLSLKRNVSEEDTTTTPFLPTSNEEKILMDDSLGMFQKNSDQDLANIETTSKQAMEKENNGKTVPSKSSGKELATNKTMLQDTTKQDIPMAKSISHSISTGKTINTSRMTPQETTEQDIEMAKKISPKTSTEKVNIGGTMLQENTDQDVHTTKSMSPKAVTEKQTKPDGTFLRENEEQDRYTKKSMSPQTSDKHTDCSESILSKEDIEVRRSISSRASSVQLNVDVHVSVQNPSQNASRIQSPTNKPIDSSNADVALLPSGSRGGHWPCKTVPTKCSQQNNIENGLSALIASKKKSTEDSITNHQIPTRMSKEKCKTYQLDSHKASHRSITTTEPSSGASSGQELKMSQPGAGDSEAFSPESSFEVQKTCKPVSSQNLEQNCTPTKNSAEDMTANKSVASRPSGNDNKTRKDCITTPASLGRSSGDKLKTNTPAAVVSSGLHIDVCTPPKDTTGDAYSSESKSVSTKSSQEKTNNIRHNSLRSSEKAPNSLKACRMEAIQEKPYTNEPHALKSIKEDALGTSKTVSRDSSEEHDIIMEPLPEARLEEENYNHPPCQFTNSTEACKTAFRECMTKLVFGTEAYCSDNGSRSCSRSTGLRCGAVSGKSEWRRDYGCPENDGRDDDSGNESPCSIGGGRKRRCRPKRSNESVNVGAWDDQSRELCLYGNESCKKMSQNRDTSYDPCIQSRARARACENSYDWNLSRRSLSMNRPKRSNESLRDLSSIRDKDCMSLDSDSSRRYRPSRIDCFTSSMGSKSRYRCMENKCTQTDEDGFLCISRLENQQCLQTNEERCYEGQSSKGYAPSGQGRSPSTASHHSHSSSAGSGCGPPPCAVPGWSPTSKVRSNQNRPPSMISDPSQPASMISGPSQAGSIISGPSQPGSIISGPSQPGSIISGPSRPASIMSGPSQPASATSGPFQPASILSGQGRQASAISGNDPSASFISDQGGVSVNELQSAPNSVMHYKILKDPMTDQKKGVFVSVVRGLKSLFGVQSQENVPSNQYLPQSSNTQQYQYSVQPSNTQQSQYLPQPSNTQYTQYFSPPSNTQHTQCSLQPTNAQYTQCSSQPSNTQYTQYSSQPSNTQYTQYSSQPSITQYTQYPSQPSNTQYTQYSSQPSNTQQYSSYIQTQSPKQSYPDYVRSHERVHSTYTNTPQLPLASAGDQPLFSESSEHNRRTPGFTPVSRYGSATPPRYYPSGTQSPRSPNLPINMPCGINSQNCPTGSTLQSPHQSVIFHPSPPSST